MMSKFLKFRAKKVGLPPGSLVPPEEQRTEELSISLFDYSARSFVEKQHASIKDCLDCLKTPGTTWINIFGVNDIQTLEVNGRHFGLHPLLLEDIMSTGQRAKLTDYKDTI